MCLIICFTFHYSGSAYANQVYDQYPGGLGPAMAARTGPNPEVCLLYSYYAMINGWVSE